MAFEILRELPSAAEFIAAAPLTAELGKAKAERDRLLREIAEGAGGRFMVVVGPCSADEEDAVCEYVCRLAKVQEKVKDRLVIVPRIYTNKPRTTGEGYKGMLHQPAPDKAPDIVAGITAIRRMHLRVMRETGLSAADEMLYPDNLPYVEDLLSYIAIGARSVENQQHRLTVSGVSVPVGMKNPMSGDLNVMINSIAAAQAGHTFVYGGREARTTGNPLAHAIMRGAVNSHGEYLQNYHYEDLIRAAELYEARGLANPMIAVDVNHSNSKKVFSEQPRIAKDVLHSRRHSKTLERLVRGVMIESYLVEGAQAVGGGARGKSITDPCLGWGETERLLYELADGV